MLLTIFFPWSKCNGKTDDESASLVSSASGESEEEEPDHHLLTGANGEMAFVKEKPVKLAKDLL